MIEETEKLKTTYPNITISNTNQVHPESINTARKNSIGIESFSSQNSKSELHSNININLINDMRSSKKIPNKMIKSTSSDIKNMLRSTPKFKERLSVQTLKKEYLENLTKAFNFLDFSGKNKFLFLIKKIFFINIQIAFFGINALSIVNLVLLNYYRIGEISSENIDFIKATEISVAVFFCAEILSDILTSKRKGVYKFLEFFSWTNIGNALFVSEILTTALNENLERINTFFILILFFRSLKIYKMVSITEVTLRTLKRNFIEFKLEDLEEPIIDEQAQLRAFVYMMGINIMSGIFIEASAFIAMNDALDHDGYAGFEQLDYVTACYFAIVSLTTIGYGDIRPLLWQARLFHIVILFLNITVVSNFFTTFIEKIYQMSPYILNYKLKDHVVIIGYIPLTLLKYFVKEIIECTKVSQNFESPLLIIGSEDPSKELSTFLKGLPKSFYLKAEVYDFLWLKQSNLAFAKHLFAFSLGKNSYYESFESDKKMAFNTQQISAKFPNLKITLILSTDFSKNVKKDSLWNKTIKTIAFSELNELILASSIFNQGFNVWLMHLMTLREKSIPITGKDTSELEDYGYSMSQEIYQITAPNYLIGKSFKQALQIIYFCTIDLTECFFNNQFKKKSGKSGLILLAIESKSHEKLLINPIEYILNEEDILFVIALDIQSAKVISQLNEQSTFHQIYLKNMTFLKHIDLPSKTQNYFEKASLNSHISLNNHEINKKNFEPSSPSKMMRMQTLERPILDFGKEIELPKLFNLIEGQSPRGIFTNHLIIKGDIDRIPKIMTVVKNYSQRAVLLFGNIFPEKGLWKKLCESFKNLHYVYGNIHSIEHVSELEPQKAYKVLILGGKYLDLDSDNIVFTRIMADFFDVKSFIVELQDETNIKFLSVNPKYDKMDFFFWPLFVKGSIHFSSCLMSVLAKAVISYSWLTFLKHLTKPIKKRTFENSKINMIEISKELAESCTCFGFLQYILMSQSPQLIGIAIIKNHKKENKLGFARHVTKTFDNFDDDRNKDNLDKIVGILDKLYGSEFFMTNPSFLMNLEQGDKVLVLGNLIDKDNNKNNEQESFNFVYTNEWGKYFHKNGKKIYIRDFNVKRKFKERTINLLNALKETVDFGLLNENEIYRETNIL